MKKQIIIKEVRPRVGGKKKRGPRLQNGSFRSNQPRQLRTTMDQSRNLSNVTRNITTNKSRQLITETEYITDLSTSVSFAVSQFNINPGNPIMFPWLASIAGRFQNYRFHKLRFRFRTTINQFATNAYGKVVFSADYDAADPAPASKQQMEATDPHADAAPYQDFVLELDPKSLHPAGIVKYIRSGLIPGGTDIKTYDAGMLNVGFSGNVVAANAGELHVEYTVELLKPILNNTVSAYQQYSVATQFAQGVNVPGSSATPFIPLLGTPSGGSAAGLLTSLGGGLYSVPAGQYLVRAMFRATSGASPFITYTSIQIMLNSAPIGLIGVYDPQNSPSTNPDFATSVFTEWLVTAKGGDVLNLQAICGFTGGTPIFDALMVVQAV